ncbi:MAG: tetratricopeptide repeat protein [Gallionella sp.]|jgi:Flp pilus assembly protein TadD
MSLLFDALKRAQGNETQQDQSPSGAAPDKKNVLLYTIAGLLLLTGGFVWYLSTQNQDVPPKINITETPEQPVSALRIVSAQQPASGIAPTSPAPAVVPSVKKSWTHPLAARGNHPQKRKSAKKPAALPAGDDPLKDGYLALSEGNLDLAERNYLAVLAERPHEKDALLGLAVIARRRQQVDRAADLYHQVLREDMGNAAAAAGLVSLSEQADPVAAESQLRELLDIKPAAHELHYTLGCVLARQQRWGEAQQAFFRAYSLAPGNALYAYNLAVSLDRLHQDAAALPYYEKAYRQAKDPTLDMNAIERRIQELSGTASR